MTESTDRRTSAPPRWAVGHPVRYVLAAGLLVVVATLAPSCRHTLDPLRNAYQCKGEIVRFGVLNQAPSASFVRPVNAPHEWPRFDKTDVGEFPRFYLGANAHGPTDIPADLRGLFLLRMEPKRTHQGPAYLALDFAPAPSRILVAFDSRFEPPWLAPPKWTKSSLTIESTQRYAGPPAMNVTYQVYETTDPVSLQKLRLPGNSYQVSWPAADGGAQYFVLVPGRTAPNTSSVVERFPHAREFCGDAGKSADDVFAEARKREHLDAAIDEWLRDGNEAYRTLVAGGYLDFQFQKVGCGAVPHPTKPGVEKGCVEGAPSISGLLSPVNGWPVRSVAAVDATRSWIRFERAGEPPKTTSLDGRVSFSVHDDGRLPVHEVSVFSGAAVTIGGKSVDRVSLGQRASFEARCADPTLPGPPFALCSKYELPVGELRLGGGATVAGTKIGALFENDAPIQVTVDLDAWEFSLGGGPVRQDLSAGGTDLDVDLYFHVVGTFQDFAPIASFAEARDRFPCLDDNRADVLLDGSASLDVGPGAAPLVSHTWIEDGGLISAKVLGSGKTLTVPMSVGFHDVTLVVEDTRGVPAHRSMRVEVFDDRIDDLQLPADRFVALPAGASAVPVDIGLPTAAERCSGAVAIDSDAPPDGRFPRGVTEVSWTVDDFNGNVVWHRQRVFALAAEHHPPPIASLVGSATVPPGGAQVLQYATKAQGTVFAADEYLVLRAPDGTSRSVDPQGQLRPAGRIGPRARSRRVGGQDTQGTLTLAPFSSAFAAPGRYEAIYTLLVPGGSHDDPGDIVALAQFAFVVQP